MIQTSIIIPTQNNWHCIKLCIDAIIKNTENYEIVFVIDERVQFEGKLALYGKVVMCQQPFIFSQRINAGITHAQGEYICLLNSDTIPEQGWLERMVRTDLLHGPGIIGARCQKNGCSNLDAHGQGEVKETHYTINMFGVLFSKRTYEVIGALDERFIYYGGEDDDYCLRALRHGFKLIISDGYVHHTVGQGFDSGMVQNLLPKTYDLFKEKWGVTMPVPSKESWIDDVRKPITRPTVSVLMPTLNHEDYIGGAIESVKNQSYKDIELLIGYDGADIGSDDTGSYKIIGFPYIGSCAVRNGLFSRSHGEYIALMDSDDIMLPGRIQQQLNAMTPDTDIIHTGYITESKDGVREKKQGKPINLNMLLNLQAVVAGGTFLMRRHCLKKEPFNQEYDRAFDFEYALRTFKKFKYKCLPEPTIIYRRHAGEHLSGNNESHKQHKQLMEKYR